MSNCVQCFGNVPVDGKRFCSQRCSGLYYGRKASRPMKFLPTHTCPVCSTQFKARHQGSSKGKGKLTVYCSRACYQAECAKKRTAKALDKKVLRVATKRKRCVRCEAEFLAISGHSKLCGACRLKRHQPQVEKSKKNPREFSCKCCGGSVRSEYGDRLRSFCSKRCSKKYEQMTSKSKRKARLRGASVVESVNPMVVFRRDGWVCGLCGVSTPQWLRGTISQFAPELDHIVPVSRGGEHSYANTRCLCRRCNAAKADRLPEEMGVAA